MFRYIVLLALVLFPYAAIAEVPKKAQQLTIDHGMSQSTVGAIYLAHDGRLWFATGDGISIYDGQSFQYIYRDVESSKGIQSNYIRSFFEDRDGNIWIGTYGGGISVYDQSATFLQGFQKDSGAIPAIDIYDFTQDQSGRIWVASEAGVFRLSKQDDQYSLDTNNLPSLLAQSAARNVLVSRTGQLFVATSSEGLLRYDISSGVLTQFTPDNSAFLSRSVQALFEDRSGDIWIGSEDAGAFKFDHNAEIFTQPVALPDENIPAITQARDGRLWFASDANGVFVANLAEGTVENYRFHEGQPYRLSSNSILALTEDGTGRMWMGTADGGASSVSIFPESFETYYPDPDGTTGPSSGVIWSVEEGNSNDIWVGTKRGLSRFWQAENRFENIDLGEGSKDVRAILRRGNKLLLGIRGRGLVEMDIPSQSLNDVVGRDGKDVVEGSYIRLLLEAKDGSIWVGTHSGVFHLDAELHVTQHYVADGEPGSLPHDRTRALYQAEDGTIWVGTSGGLSRFDAETKTFFTYSGKTALPDDDVRAVFQANTGTVYAGTQGGIAILDLATGKSRFILRQQGLPNETLYSLLPDGRGALWVTTNNGLARFDLSSEAIRVFRARDGLQGAEFNFNAHKALSDGRIVVGGINGLSIFDPAKLRTNTLAPKLSLQVNSETIQQTDTSSGDVISLGSAPQDISFSFGVHHYDEPGKNRLQWKLEPGDVNWNEAEGVSYDLLREKLPAGNYTLRFMGLSSSGVATDEQAYRFKVATNVWQRWYAILGYFLLAALMFMALLSLRTAQIRRRTLELEREVDEKTAELVRSNAALTAASKERTSFYSRTAHEIRTPLSLIQAPLQNILGAKTLSPLDRRYAEIIERATKRLVQITDEMASVSQGKREIATGQVTLDLTAFLSPILDLYRESAETKGLRFQCDTVPSGAMTFDHGTVETILHNLLSNAVKNTPPAGVVEFACHMQRGELNFSVSNDGPGFTQRAMQTLQDYSTKNTLPPAKRGLELIAESVRTAGGTLSVESHRASIRVSLPAHSLTREEQETPATVEAAGGERILIVEDDRDLREYLVEMLSPLANIQTVASITAARRVVEREVFHLVLCDVMLPDGSGFDFGKWMKEEVETSHIPLVFLTARTDEPSYEKGLAAWADDYLTKPFEASELLQKIRIRLRAVTRVREHMVKQLSHHLPTTEESPALSPTDERFVERFQAFLKAQIGNSAASIEDAAKHCNMSKRAFQRKLDALYGQSFSSLLTTARMTRAAELLKAGMSVSEVASACAYQSASGFSRQFRETHGQSPRDFMKDSSR